MNYLENNCQNLLVALKNGDTEAYKRLRLSIVTEISDIDYIVRPFDDNFTVGKVLTILLDDLPHTGSIYKRIVLISVFTLLNVIINDKADHNPKTAIASALLLILYSENQDFIGGEYIASMVRTTDAAAHQFIGMQCVFYWKYKFNESKQSLLPRTQQRLQHAINSSVIDIPDISTRNKIIDFEYDNFNTMLKDLPIDVELKYPGLPILDPEMVKPKIQSLFNSDLLYFKIPNDSSNKIKEENNGLKKTDTPSGCLNFLISFIVISLITAFSLL